MYELQVFTSEIRNIYEDTKSIDIISAVCIKKDEVFCMADNFEHIFDENGRELKVIKTIGSVCIVEYGGATPIEIASTDFTTDREMYAYPRFDYQPTRIVKDKLVHFNGIPGGYLAYLSQYNEVYVLNIFIVKGIVLYSMHDEIKIGTKIKKPAGNPAIDIYKAEVEFDGKMIKAQHPMSEKTFRFRNFILKQHVSTYYIHNGYMLTFRIMALIDADLRFRGRDIIAADGKPIYTIEDLMNCKKMTIAEDMLVQYEL